VSLDTSVIFDSTVPEGFTSTAPVGASQVTSWRIGSGPLTYASPAAGAEPDATGYIPLRFTFASGAIVRWDIDHNPGAGYDVYTMGHSFVVGGGVSEDQGPGGTVTGMPGTWELSSYRLPFVGGPTQKCKGQKTATTGYRITNGPGCGSGEDGHNDPAEAEAIDYGLPPNTAVLAARSGRVTFAGGNPNRSYGPRVEITHSDGSISRYAHLSNASIVANGSTVARGQLIGRSGATGTAKGHPHLHFDVRTATGTPIPVRTLPTDDVVLRQSGTAVPGKRQGRRRRSRPARVTTITALRRATYK
jgi:murein DD-endopeptidase MepM/ murein hydrolase activator NlpD